MGLSKEINPFQIEKSLENLEDNYRSGSEVVNFNNEFFQFASSVLSFPEYEELFKEAFQNPKNGEYGFVQVQFLEAKNKEEEFEIHPETVLKIIEDLDAKGFSRNDICILTRRKKEGYAIAEYLSEHDIKVMSSESLLLTRSEKVKFIAHILEFSLNPENKSLKLEILGFLAENHFPATDYHHVISKHIDDDTEKFSAWLKLFKVEFEMEKVKQLSLYESVEYIIRSFKLVQQSDAYIQFFLDFVFETAQKGANSLNEFIEKWHQKKEKLSIVVPEAEDAVKIMTIHTSKGLEFPIVIFPFAESDLQDTRNDSLWIETGFQEMPVAYVNASKKMLNWNLPAKETFEDLLQKNELDTLNVLYVACTRAAEQLYLLSSYNEKPKSSACISNLLKDYVASKQSENEQRIYEFGEISSIPKTEESLSLSIQPSEFYSSPTENEAVHIVTKSGSLWDSRQQEAIEKGKITHEIMSKINSASDRFKAIEWAVNSGLLKERDRDSISSNIEKILEHPELKEYFQQNVINYNEKEILTASGKRLRPDRINLAGKSITIIDYKTGGFVDTHERQILNYASVLREMEYKVDKCLLVYTNNNIMVKNVKEI
ncbi:UvrD-helicase domain-containing protein [Christiangramia antarctica]|uniref:UvrD-helicase domain-containing protein n=1 Tax=Christiangramia antarctica TaxID=2058158 RepID=A0ABW5X373_9FLAO